ncbi:DUF6082 family protein [Asanoa iriomotensis]|uniref:Uncharacterized protein n=1 Tax=Asanoa iriomotensis TaxID=234613 RepID=A0ABQ4CGA0_9ACTN|nr:DUF6082 family protein [Asanoa iriomotensis]GIF61819.1 hypothetical protein Air01nite_79140 [Asanoa iriomotensis]
MRRPVWRLAWFTALCFFALGLGFGSALGLLVSADAWRFLSDVGQAFGTLSALLSAVALLGVWSSIRLQTRQAEVAKFEAVRGIRGQLIQFAFDEPELLSLWGFDPTDGEENMREAAYLSMIFSFWKMAYAVGAMTDLELVTAGPVIFRSTRTRAWWADARGTYLADTASPEVAMFARMMDAQYQLARIRHRPTGDEGA